MRCMTGAHAIHQPSGEDGVIPLRDFRLTTSLNRVRR
jgi:hypothetical protein